MRNGQSLLRIWLIAAACLLGLAVSCMAQRPPMNITPQQKDQLKQLATQTRNKTVKIRGGLRQARCELLDIYMNYNLNERKAQATISKINKFQMALLKIHMDNQIELRHIFNQDKFEQFAKMVMQRPGHKRPGFRRMSEDVFPSEVLSKRSLSELGVSDDQQKRAVALTAKMRDRDKLIEQLHRDTAQLLNMYSKYNLNSPTAMKLIENIHKSQVVLSKINHRKQQILRSVLNESQFEQLKSKVARRANEMKKDEQKRGARN